MAEDGVENNVKAISNGCDHNDTLPEENGLTSSIVDDHALTSNFDIEPGALRVTCIECEKLRNAEKSLFVRLKETEWKNEKLAEDIENSTYKVRKLGEEHKLTIDKLNSSHTEKINVLESKLNALNSEKTSFVMKFADSEQKRLAAETKAEKALAKTNEVMKDRELLTQRIRSLHSDFEKSKSQLSDRQKEINTLRREIERQRDSVSSVDIKVKWAENKLRAEQKAHAETRLKSEETQRRLVEAKEEGEQIRQDCQAMLRKYEDADMSRAEQLDNKLKDAQALLQKQTSKTSDHEETTSKLQSQITLLVEQQSKNAAQIENLTSQLSITGESLKNETGQKTRLQAELEELKRLICGYKAETERLQEEIMGMNELKEHVKIVAANNEELKELNVDLEQEAKECRLKEGEMLIYTEKLTSRNTLLQVECNNLQDEVAKTREIFDKLQETQAQNKCLKDETQELKKKEETMSSRVEKLESHLSSRKDELRASSRKFRLQIQDLNRQISQIERQNPSKNGSDVKSVCSNSSSQRGSPRLGRDERVHETLPQNEDNIRPEVEYLYTETLQPRKQDLIEKIVRLQRSLARRNEKIDFLHEHIKRLVGELDRKTRVIQYYALREESGLLTANEVDLSRADLSRRGGIMASLYGSKSHDEAMTLRLSLDINRKLQQVLEDTILKNMTLKESMETLGGEIAKLSQDNRALRLGLS